MHQTPRRLHTLDSRRRVFYAAVSAKLSDADRVTEKYLLFIKISILTMNKITIFKIFWVLKMKLWMVPVSSLCHCKSAHFFCPAYKIYFSVNSTNADRHFSPNTIFRYTRVVLPKSSLRIT